MKVVHLNQSDIQGGAARAAYRLHSGLVKAGVDSKMLVDSRISDDLSVYGLTGIISRGWGIARPLIYSIPFKFHKWQGAPFYIPLVGRNVMKHDQVEQADIIHLHWIAGGFLSVRGISQLAKLNKPVVWTLHDMWAFTGGCHYSGECKNYMGSCGSCPQLGSGKDNDITRDIWKKKRKAYKNLNPTIVTPSRWLNECAKKSPLCSGLNTQVIPSGLDARLFKPLDKLMARGVLNLPENKKIILFGADGVSQERKGFRYLQEAIRELEQFKAFNKDELSLVIFGASHLEGIEALPYKTKFLGRLYDDFSLALAYSAADVFVSSSLEDNLPNTVMESLSCGTPVAAFNVGGIPEMIDHGVNGYLAEYKNSRSLAEGIRWVLEDENRAVNLRKDARKKAAEEYSLQVTARRYNDLYQSLLISKKLIK